MDPPKCSNILFHDRDFFDHTLFLAIRFGPDQQEIHPIGQIADIDALSVFAYGIMLSKVGAKQSKWSLYQSYLCFKNKHCTFF
ncbi:hypothetical protein K8S19_04730 [bacterium]|nr:hypothetical protein [bacterium]